MSMRGFTKAAVALAAGGLIAIASPALAQDGPGGRGGGFGAFGGFGGGMGGDALTPGFNSRELDKFGDMLAMTPEQREDMKLLFEGYMEEFQAKAGEARDAMESARDEFRESRDPSVWEGVGQKMREFRDSSQKMEATFFADMRSLLTEEQAASFERVERLHRRETSLRRGFISGERVNLFSLVEDLELAEDAAAPLADVLHLYEVDLDREIVRRTAEQEKIFEELDQLRRDGDFEAMQGIVEKGRESSVRVRDVNRRYARQIEGLLPAEKQAEFQAAFQRESFPMVYRPTRASRMIAAAEGFADLTAEQAQAIGTLKGGYTRDLDGVNAKLAKAQEDMEMNFEIREMFRGGGDQGEAGELRQQRRELDDATIASLQKILTPAQIERLPQDDERGGRERGGGGQRQRRQELN